MNALTSPKNHLSVVHMYEEKFGVQIPEGILKHAATIQMFRQLKAEMMQAIESGTPIKDWSNYALPLRSS